MAAQPLSTSSGTSTAAASASAAAASAGAATSASTSTAATATATATATASATATATATSTSTSTAAASTGATWMPHPVDGSHPANGSVEGPTMPAGYLPLYEADVEAAAAAAEAEAEDAGYALIDDISEWLLGSVGGGGGGPGGGAENSTIMAANETLGWLEVLNSTLPTSRSNASSAEEPLQEADGDDEGELRGRYALRSFVEQQLGGGGGGRGGGW
ncbi:dopamine D2-like receptor [Drosophila gunungcola]|uniref:dopamine D2-like receptor n=1 Tax=Drosophila gunungcola TaxID=103775 RepID=UPI0022E88B65|nr:dopamine D2-like receptor [Drosophila gunungcola]